MVIAIATLAFTCVFSTCNNAGETKNTSMFSAIISSRKKRHARRTAKKSAIAPNANSPTILS